MYSTSVGYASDGDVTSDNDSANGAWTYQYDPMNRLVQANCGTSGGCAGDSIPDGNGLSFVYDRFGNLWQTNYVNGGQAGAQVTFAGGTNRIDGGSYSPEGDLLGDGSHSYAYDAENRLENVDGGATASYSYFPSGQRATKTTGGNTYWYLYDESGQQLAKLNTSGVLQRGEIFAGNRHLATYATLPSVSTYFVHSDWLGTTRSLSDMSGHRDWSAGSWPFGQEFGTTQNPSSLFFTGKQHDFESGLDYFGARYDSSSYGRFMTLDLSAAPERSTDRGTHYLRAHRLPGWERNHDWLWTLGRKTPQPLPEQRRLRGCGRINFYLLMGS